MGAPGGCPMDVSSGSAPQTKPIQVIDCDVHWRLRPADLVPYFPEPYRSRRNLARLLSAGHVYGPYGDPSRVDSKPKNGLAGSDPDLFRRHVFVDAEIDLAINLPSG